MKRYPPLFLALVLVLIAVVSLPRSASAQRQIVTDHFYVYFDGNSERTAKRVADVAEEVFDALASSFGFYEEFSRIHILVHDDQDFSNGFANYYQNRVEIWASDLDFPHLRGSHEWIKLVVTHEVAHIISLKVAAKGPFNAVIFQSGQFNQNPDFVLQLPWLHLAAPMWYVEGIAQYADEEIGYDKWDTHRDMLLRMATLEDDLLTYDEMSVFAHSSIHSEMVYNQGFAFLRYIRDRFGRGKAEAMIQEVGYFRFDGAVKKVLGISARDLYAEWKQDLRLKYTDQAGNLLQTRLGTRQEVLDRSELTDFDLNLLMAQFDERFEGDLLIDGGSFDLQPTISPDGTKLAYLSNEGSDFVITTIWIQDLLTGERRNTRQRAVTALSWTSDGRSVVYGRRVGAFYDLFTYDIETKKAKRASANLRIRDPAVSPDGKTVAFLRNEDGGTNIGLMNLDGTEVRYLTNNNDGTLYYSPNWSPDGKTIVFSVFRGEDRDIAVIDADSPTFVRVQGRKIPDTDSLAFADVARFRPLIHSSADERDPAWLPDGSGIVFSSDQEGIFNIYEFNLTTGAVTRRSDVPGGAFQATVSPDGNLIVYAGYHADNYSLFTLDRRTSLEEDTPVVSIDRDYSTILGNTQISESYEISGVPRRLSLSGVVPIVGFSQTFIGNEFGLNAVDLGAQISIDDVLGRDRIFLTGSVGLNFRNRIDPNLSGTLVYERQLPPLLTKNRALAPTIYGVADRSIINNLQHRSLAFNDTSNTQLVVQLVGGAVDTVDGTVITEETFQSRDQFKFDFRTYALGLRLPISSRQTALLEYSNRRYLERFESGGPDHIKQRIFAGSQLLADIDTTTVLSGVSLDDARFFSSKSLLMFWNYRSLTPTLDSGINPTGGRDLTLFYRRQSSTVTDSLVQATERVIDGRTVPIAPDPTQFAPLTPVRNKLSLNELGFQWTEYLRLPIPKHTLTASALIRYQDKRFREADEGGGFYWPLRIYMGGRGTLSGYPYFTLSGSKAAFWRVSYTMPIIPKIHKSVPFLYLNNLYFSTFWEGGTTWNFETLTNDALKTSRILHSVGAELKMQVFSFYRVPMTAYFQVAMPLTDITERSRRNLGLATGQNIDNIRYYFGFGLF
jgi:Tol biopolymer transport system component